MPGTPERVEETEAEVKSTNDERLMKAEVKARDKSHSEMLEKALHKHIKSESEEKPDAADRKVEEIIESRIAVIQRQIEEFRQNGDNVTPRSAGSAEGDTDVVMQPVVTNDGADTAQLASTSSNDEVAMMPYKSNPIAYDVYVTIRDKVFRALLANTAHVEELLVDPRTLMASLAQYVGKGILDIRDVAKFSSVLAPEFKEKKEQVDQWMQQLSKRVYDEFASEGQGRKAFEEITGKMHFSDRIVQETESAQALINFLLDARYDYGAINSFVLELEENLNLGWLVMEDVKKLHSVLNPTFEHAAQRIGRLIADGANPATDHSTPATDDNANRSDRQHTRAA